MPGTSAADPEDHDHAHGGHREPGNDALHWNERYAATDRLWSAEPNRTVEEVVGPLPPGRALDLGAGEGRHAVWLARRGWRVTAVDFSALGIERGRQQGGAGSAGRVEWIVGDVRTWQPPSGTTYDLVLVVYLHVTEDVFGRARSWLAPGGALVVVGHALRNLTDGVGGPRDPRLLHTEDQLRAAASGLEIDELREVLRPTPEGEAIDLLLVAHRPGV
ncbi:MAG TPA: methyltransferase domain-containing protein [Acidimicrobiales bacterium]|jgi:SAM-dependent methyltransferase|nr:methyltransferase domain-containing protein [Acidimicrobiales bacterium]